MNTILTDDERPKLPSPSVLHGVSDHNCPACRSIIQHVPPIKLGYAAEDMEAYADAREAAVLAKLREQEPVAWMDDFGNAFPLAANKGAGSWIDAHKRNWKPLYTNPLPLVVEVQAYRTSAAYDVGYKDGLAAAPLPAVVQVPQEIDVDGRRIAAEAENHACSIAVWMTRMDAESPDAEDLGVSGWLQEAETRIKRRMLAAAPEAPAADVEMSPDFTDTARAGLLWVLWHHQGGSSEVGQPIRFALGIGQHEHLNAHQVREAKRWGALNPKPKHEAPAQAIPAPWREAVKVALQEARSVIWQPTFPEVCERIDGLIARLDALEGGE